MAKKNRLNLVPAKKSDLTIGTEYYVVNSGKPKKQIRRNKLPFEDEEEYEGYKRFLSYLVDEGMCFLDRGRNGS